MPIEVWVCKACGEKTLVYVEPIEVFHQCRHGIPLGGKARIRKMRREGTLRIPKKRRLKASE